MSAIERSLSIPCGMEGCDKTIGHHLYDDLVEHPEWSEKLDREDLEAIAEHARLERHREDGR